MLAERLLDRLRGGPGAAGRGAVARVGSLGHPAMVAHPHHLAGRTSTASVGSIGIFRAHPTASSMPGTSMT